MPPAPHVVLLGDSIFDNAAYTRGEPAVIDHLRTLLPDGWEASLAAVDGATTRSVGAQVGRVPDSATHLVLALGGNDALGEIDVLSRPVSSTAEALHLFRDRLDPFESAYARVVERLLARGLPLTVCTIYNGWLDRAVADSARLALAMFNDVIIRTAVSAGADVIELRQVCDRRDDYANPIEPSGTGGRRIAGAIARAVGAVPRRRQTLMLGGSA